MRSRRTGIAFVSGEKPRSQSAGRRARGSGRARASARARRRRARQALRDVARARLELVGERVAAGRAAPLASARPQASSPSSIHAISRALLGQRPDQRECADGPPFAGSREAVSHASYPRQAPEPFSLCGAGTTTTGMCAWRAHWSLTDPSTSPMKPPCPRAPTTSRSASWHWSSSTCVLPPSIASQRTSDARGCRRRLLARGLADAGGNRLRRLDGGLDAHVARRVPGRRVGSEPRRPGMDHVQLVAAQRGLARGPRDSGARALRAVGSDHDASHAALQSRVREHIIAPAACSWKGPARRAPRTPLHESPRAPDRRSRGARSPWRWPAAARAAARGGTPLALVTADSEDRILAVRLTDMRVVRSLAVPHEPHGIEAVDLLRAALVMSNESGTVTVLDATARGCAGCSRASRPALRRRRSARPLRLRQRRPARARSSRSTCRRARVIGRVEVGEGARHISISPDGDARRHLARLAGAAARARRRHRARSARGSCARSPPTTSPTTSASRRTASSSGSARASTGASPCTTRARCGRCTPCPAMRAAARHVRRARGARLRREWRERDAAHLSPGRRQAAAHEPRHDRLLQRLRARRPRDHAVARRRQAHAARRPRPAQRAPRAARARRLHRRRPPSRWPAWRPSRPGAP